MELSSAGLRAMATGDVEAAEVYFERGVALGDSACEYQLGRLHAYHLARSPDLIRGAKLVFNAALSGQPDAIGQLATWDAAGQLRVHDCSREIDWLQRGFDSGHPACVCQRVIEALRSGYLNGETPTLPENYLSSLRRLAAKGSERAIALLAYYLRIALPTHRNVEKAAEIIEFFNRQGVIIPMALWGDAETRGSFRSMKGRDGSESVVPPTESGFAICQATRVISPPEILYLAVHVSRKLRPSQTTGAGGTRLSSAYRTSDDYCVDPLEEDPVLSTIQARMTMAFNKSVLFAEPLTILRYRVGQQYRLHTDLLPRNEIEIGLGRNSGQRVQTHILYLNNDYSGGETEFPAVGLRYRGSPGSVLSFNSVYGASELTESAHRGCSVGSGEKWIATLWMRERPVRPVYEVRYRER